MRQIALDSLCVENFRSFIQPTAIAFTASTGLKFVGGVNRVEPALGANGAGKSTVFDAICFALYGTSVRGLRPSELKSYGARATAVLLLLQIDGALVAIRRTAPPERLTIDDRPVVQADVDRLVGLNRRRFLNSVVFGQAAPLFIDLDKPGRGQLLDDVLDLQMWLRAASRATDRHNQLSAEHTKLRIEAERLDAALAAQPDLNELQANEDGWEIERKGRLADVIGQYETIEAEIAQATAEMPPPGDQNAVNKAKCEYDERRSDITELDRRLAVMERDGEQRLAEAKFFNENETCPTCGQDLTAEFRRAHLRELNVGATQWTHAHASVVAMLATARTEAQELEAVWQQLLHDAHLADRARAVATAERDARHRQSDDLQRQAMRVNNEKNPYTAQRQQAAAERARLKTELGKARAAEAAMLDRLTAVHYWRQGFRRVRVYCLENVLRELALETHNALATLGLAGWEVYYTTEDETRLGVEVEVQPPDEPAGRFHVLSGGEGQRARLAASLGLASLVQRWAAVQWSFEVWDEPTAWLSEQGVEQLLDCLAYRAQSHNKAIFIADHRALSHSGFAETYLVTKDQQGSRWERA